ncbi:MAG: DUF4403 family protein [Cetobacterium sp.]|uniref:DUF4403 family protein n=1 Tax=Cetobacterium sp. TaxID=2071632 RepID=UPI002FCB6E8F
MNLNKKFKIIIFTTLLINHTTLLANTTTQDEISKIDLTISTKKSTIENILNQEIPKLINDSGSGNEIIEKNSNNKLLNLGISLLDKVHKKSLDKIQNFKWKYSIQRDDINFSANNRTIEALANFNGTVLASLEETNSEELKSDISGTIGIKTDLSIDENWNLLSSSSPIFKLSDANIPLNFDLKGIKIKKNINLSHDIEKHIDPILKKTISKVDEYVKDFKLHSFIEEKWQILKNPILINKNYRVWLLLNPVNTRYSDFMTNQDNLGVKIGLDSYVSLYLGDKPNPLIQSNLPPIKYGTVDDNFNMILPIYTTYNYINEILEETFNGDSYPINSFSKVRVEDINFLGTTNKLNLNAKVIFTLFEFLDFKGIINCFFTTPGEDFDYTLKTNNFILKIVDSFFHSTIKKAIENKIISEKNNLKDKMSEVIIDKNTTLKNKIITLEIKSITTENESIKILTTITGTSTLEIR